jgi:predicted enzyme related to lactoylglutathione lyase
MSDLSTVSFALEGTMTIHTSHAHGTFSWLELATTDATAAKRFYGELLGWSYEDRPAGPDMIYTMCKLGDRYAAALYAISGSPPGASPQWSSYVTVTDVDTTTREAIKRGSSVIKEPFDVMDVGRMAIFRDPTGAPLCLWTARKHIGAEVIDEPGALAWNELLTTDTKLAAEFYSGIFGWTTSAVDMGPAGTYTIFKRTGATRDVAGMMAMPADMKGVPSHWLGYFAVADCDKSAGRASEQRGRVLVPPTDIPNVGRFAVVQDPQGARFAIFARRS